MFLKNSQNIVKLFYSLNTEYKIIIQNYSKRAHRRFINFQIINNNFKIILISLIS